MNAMIGTEIQKRQFSDRLTRIARGGENTTRHVYIGPVEEAVNRGSARKSRRVRRVATLRRSGRTFFSEIFMVPFAMLAGGAAVIAGRVAEFHLVTPELTLQAGVAAPYVVYANVAIALALWVILGRVFRLRGGSRGRAMLSGFLAMMLFEGIAIARYPHVFAQLYSEPYVAGVVAKLSV